MAEPAPDDTKKPVLGDRYKTPPETIQDGDITLRRWRLSDADGLLAAATASLPELQVWMPWAKDGYTMGSAEWFVKFAVESWDAGSEYNYALIVDGEPAGSFGLMDAALGDVGMCMGYWVATPVTGKGLATRAAGLLTRTALELGAEAVQICHHVDNERSKAVPRRLGYRHVGDQELPWTKFAGVQGVWQMDRPEK
ncbi:hypothetical protein K4F52_007895 [Lecanicillium sp. MT-2017a]|nr:hypothetical protein K4F52_007895 [Lecanicillium sp. MT-2017a]